ncbi:hypothetical protein SDC9_196728 [bioreactor metagenome]|uniref:Minor capsid protein n=1 Tax=bioreactor metagenome TaxID=1076179 RepID=A0A645ICU0_9ZZZZ
MGLEIKPTRQLLSERGLEIGQKVQTFIDSEAVRLMEKYTPKRTGAMRDSVYSASQFGTGELNQNTPYSRKQYYDDTIPHRGITTHHWFEAMKSNGGVAKILNGAARLAGARGVKA